MIKKEFIAAIKKDIEHAVTFFKEHKNELDKDYSDEEGNIYLHHIINSLAEYIKSTCEANKAGELDYKKYLDLIDALLRAGFTYHQANNSGKLPLDNFQNALEKYPDNNWEYGKIIVEINDAKSKVMGLLERGQFLYPGKKYVGDLDLKRGSKKENKVCKIPDRWNKLNDRDNLELTLHQRLALFEAYLRHKNLHKNAKNLAIVNIGFVISDKPKVADKNAYRRIFVTFPLSDKENILIGEKPANSFDLMHSEDNLLNYLKQDIVFDYILEQLRKLGYKQPDQPDQPDQPAHKIYAIIMDIHSTNEICYDCTRKLIDLQQNYKEDSFLKKLEDKLRGKYLLPKKSFAKSQHPKVPISKGSVDITQNQDGDSSENFYPSPKKRKLSEDHTYSGLFLPLIIRASGLGAPGNFEKPAKSNKAFYCSQVHETYNNDIKTFTPGVLLHLPRMYDSEHSTLPHEKKCGLHKMYLQRLQKNFSGSTLLTMHEQGFFCFNKQTAFANSSEEARTAKRGTNEAEAETEGHSIFDTNILIHGLKI